MRAALWPDADPAALTQEAVAYLDGTSQMIAAAWITTDGLGFIELSIRPFSDGCDSMPVPHVEGWYVEPAARGQSVGRALLAAAEEWCRAKGFMELASDSELANTGSLRAHAACGFQEVDRLVKFRKILRQ